MTSFSELNENRKKSYDRNKLDDICIRKKIKEESFGKNKTYIDISGETVHKNSQAAINKYGAVNSWKHRVDIDHKMSLKTISKRGKALGISADKLKKIANDKSNLRILNAVDNRAKGDSSDLDMAYRFLSDGELKKGTNFAINGIANEVNVDGKLIICATEEKTSYVTNNYRDNIGALSKNASKYASNIARESTIPLLVAGVHNMVAVAQGNKSAKEAAKNCLLETSTVVVSSKLQQAGVNAVNQVLKKSGVKVLERAAGANIIGNVVIIGMRVNDSFVRLLDGKIDAGKFVVEVTVQGGTLAAETLGAMVGQTLIPIPVAGAIIGSMITSVVCGLIVDLMSTARNSMKLVKEKRKTIEEVSARAKLEIDKQRDELKQLIKVDQEKWDECINDGYRCIFGGIKTNNVEAIADGLNTILSQFGKAVRYLKYEDFNEDFMNKSFKFTL